jgi:hypothetical protein
MEKRTGMGTERRTGMEMETEIWTEKRGQWAGTEMETKMGWRRWIV